MQVVSVKEQSGIYVRSAGNARRYLQIVGGKIELRQKKQRLRALLAQQEAVARQVSELCGSILDDSIQPVPSSEQMQSFSCRIPQDWPDSGKSLGSLHFWQATGATVVAIGRAEALSISPGRTQSFCGGDLVIFCGRSGGTGGCRPILATKQHDPAGVCLPEGKETHMVHNEIHAIDLTIVGVYLVAMVLIGLVVVKKVRSMDDYYLGGCFFGPLVLMATVCATIIGGSGLMGRAGVAYSSGFKAIMTALPYLLGMFIFSGFAGRISDIGTKFHVSSIPDLFEQRFGRIAKVVLGCLIAFTMMGTVASQVTATATIINMLGGEIGISYEMGALIACAVFIVYTATSGLFGVIYTDVFQFIMLILFVYMPRSLLAAALGAIASYSAARSVHAVRLVFCDAVAYDQGVVRPDSLFAEAVHVQGRGEVHSCSRGIDLLERAEDFPKRCSDSADYRRSA